MAPDFEPHHRCTFGHHHERCGLLGGLLVPPHQRVARRLHVDPQRSLHQTPQQQRQPSHQPQGFDPLGLLQKQTVDHDGGFYKSKVLLHPVWFLLGPQDLSCPMRHLPCRGHIRQEPKTARLLLLAGHDLRPLVERNLQAIAQRLDHTGLLWARPARALRWALLDDHRHPVIGALQRPQLLGGGLGICPTKILLLRCCTHGRR